MAMETRSYFVAVFVVCISCFNSLNCRELSKRQILGGQDLGQSIRQQASGMLSNFGSGFSSQMSALGNLPTAPPLFEFIIPGSNSTRFDRELSDNSTGNDSLVGSFNSTEDSAAANFTSGGSEVLDNSSILKLDIGNKSSESFENSTSVWNDTALLGSSTVPSFFQANQLLNGSSRTTEITAINGTESWILTTESSVVVLTTAANMSEPENISDSVVSDLKSSDRIGNTNISGTLDRPVNTTGDISETSTSSSDNSSVSSSTSPTGNRSVSDMFILVTTPSGSESGNSSSTMSEAVTSSVSTAGNISGSGRAILSESDNTTLQLSGTLRDAQNSSGNTSLTEKAVFSSPDNGSLTVSGSLEGGISSNTTESVPTATSVNSSIGNSSTTSSIGSQGNGSLPDRSALLTITAAPTLDITLHPESGVAETNVSTARDFSDASRGMFLEADNNTTQVSAIQQSTGSPSDTTSVTQSSAVSESNNGSVTVSRSLENASNSSNATVLSTTTSTTLLRDSTAADQRSTDAAVFPQKQSAFVASSAGALMPNNLSLNIGSNTESTTSESTTSESGESSPSVGPQVEVVSPAWNVSTITAQRTTASLQGSTTEAPILVELSAQNETWFESTPTMSNEGSSDSSTTDRPSTAVAETDSTTVLNSNATDTSSPTNVTVALLDVVVTDSGNGSSDRPNISTDQEIENSTASNSTDTARSGQWQWNVTTPLPELTSTNILVSDIQAAVNTTPAFNFTSTNATDLKFFNMLNHLEALNSTIPPEWFINGTVKPKNTTKLVIFNLFAITEQPGNETTTNATFQEEVNLTTTVQPTTAETENSTELSIVSTTLPIQTTSQWLDNTSVSQEDVTQTANFSSNVDDELPNSTVFNLTGTGNRLLQQPAGDSVGLHFFNQLNHLEALSTIAPGQFVTPDRSETTTNLVVFNLFATSGQENDTVLNATLTGEQQAELQTEAENLTQTNNTTDLTFSSQLNDQSHNATISPEWERNSTTGSANVAEFIDYSRLPVNFINQTLGLGVNGTSGPLATSSVNRDTIVGWVTTELPTQTLGPDTQTTGRLLGNGSSVRWNTTKGPFDMNFTSDSTQSSTALETGMSTTQTQTPLSDIPGVVRSGGNATLSPASLEDQSNASTNGSQTDASAEFELGEVENVTMSPASPNRSVSTTLSSGLTDTATPSELTTLVSALTNNSDSIIHMSNALPSVPSSSINSTDLQQPVLLNTTVGTRNITSTTPHSTTRPADYVSSKTASSSIPSDSDDRYQLNTDDFTDVTDIPTTYAFVAETDPPTTRPTDHPNTSLVNSTQSTPSLGTSAELRATTTATTTHQLAPASTVLGTSVNGIQGTTTILRPLMPVMLKSNPADLVVVPGHSGASAPSDVQSAAEWTLPNFGGFGEDEIPQRSLAIPTGPVDMAGAASQLQILAAPTVKTIPRKKLVIAYATAPTSAAPISKKTDDVSRVVYKPDDPDDEKKFWSLIPKPLNAGQVAKIQRNAGREVQYPTFDQAPQTSFSCSNVSQPGYYADAETGCQAYHRCDLSGSHFRFLCPKTTLFSQLLMVCDYWYNVNCDEQVKHADYVNSRMYHGIAYSRSRFRAQTNSETMTTFPNPANSTDLPTDRAAVVHTTGPNITHAENVTVATMSSTVTSTLVPTNTTTVSLSGIEEP